MREMLDPIRRTSTFVVSLALAVTLSAACKQSPKVDVPVGPGSQGAKEGDMVTTALDQAAKMTVEEYNPARVVEAVNALQPLGKEKALEQIDAYLRSRAKGNQAQGLFWRVP